MHRRGITDSSMTAASGGGRECENAQKPESQARALRLAETTWFQDGRVVERPCSKIRSTQFNIFLNSSVGRACGC